MNMKELLKAIEALTGGTFTYSEGSTNLYDRERYVLKSANGDIKVYVDDYVQFDGHTRTATKLTTGDLTHVYEHIVECVKDHQARFAVRVKLLRDAVEVLRPLAQSHVEYVELFNTSRPTISVRSEGHHLFMLQPRFQTVFLRFTDYQDFEETDENYNATDMRISDVAEKGRRLPSGLHTFELDTDNETPYGLHAFLTPKCVITVRDLLIQQHVTSVVPPWPDAALQGPFYDKLRSKRLIKVIEYFVP